MTYAVVAICKNESENIDRFIAAVKPYVSHAVIVDTGSTDGTLDAVYQFDCPVTVEQIEWVNFGHARSHAFALARGKAEWTLALDCDMTVEIDPDFEPDPDVDAYMIRMGDNPDFAYRLPLLLRGDLPWQSVGVVHEYTALPDRAYIGVPTDKVRVTLHGDRSSPAKSRWHAEMLEADIAEHPDNARTVFYLANTYWDLHDPRALEMYERRSKMDGYVEEVFYSLYRYALLLPTWPAKMQGLIKAWEFRPQRLEPVYEIAKALNAKGDHYSAYRFASVPVVAPSDNLFVEMGAYRWGLDFERSIAAYWVGNKDECRDLCDSLLARDIPDYIRQQVERNKAFC